MEDLEARKVYQILPDREAAREGYIRVVDESGEDYVYPSDLFVPVRLPAAVVRRLRGPVRPDQRPPAGRFGEPGNQIGTQAPRRCSARDPQLVVFLLEPQELELSFRSQDGQSGREEIDRRMIIGTGATPILRPPGLNVVDKARESNRRRTRNESVGFTPICDTHARNESASPA